MSRNPDRAGPQSGFTLIEVLIASMILVASVVGMLVVCSQALRSTTNAGRSSILSHLAAQKAEQLRALPLTDSDLTIGVHPGQSTDSAGQKYYAATGFDEDVSLRWTVSAGPTDGTGTAEADMRTLAIEATFRVRYTIPGVPIRDQNSLEVSLATFVTD